jgi:transcriptional regulator with GAF, ATPase, and Fis domain
MASAPQDDTKDATATFPRLIDLESGRVYAMSARIVTLGSAPECAVRLADASLPSRCAHLMFTQGTYRLQALHRTQRIYVNDTKCTQDTQQPVSHGDRITIGPHAFELQEYEQAQDAVRSPVHEASKEHLARIIEVVVSLLRNRDQDVSQELVSRVSRLLCCDAARLVSEAEEPGQRATVAHYPRGAHAERFSRRAIEWAARASQTVLVHDTHWQEEEESIGSLERNLVGSVLCAPLQYEQETLGFLYLDRVKSAAGFSEQDRRFCDTLRPLFSQLLAIDRERRHQRDVISRLQRQRKETTGGMIYESTVMDELMQKARTIAMTRSPVLLLGETGTGKELMARYIHAASPRAQQPFKALNCGAIPETLIESELFGHEKGAFTGATARKPGVFEAASGGTVFLDEIGELPSHMQVKLLRVLQEGEITRVGGTDTRAVDVRIIAATNRDLQKDVADARFRQDLFFRLNVLPVTMPPLRSREQDVLLLAHYFITTYCDQFGMPPKQLSSSAREALLLHHWPGNVREMENVIQKAVLLSKGRTITAADCDFSHTAGHTGTHAAQDTADHAPVSLKQARQEAEKEAIDRSLSRAGGNVSKAAALLQIDRKWLMKKMDSLGIDANVYRMKYRDV